MMKPVVAIVLLAAAIGWAQTPAAAPAITPGIAFKVELQAKLDTKKAKVGDKVVAKVNDNVKDHGVTLIAKNTMLTGMVTEAVPAQGNQPAKLGVLFDVATPKSGAAIHLRAAIVKVIPDTFGDNASMISRPAEMSGGNNPGQSSTNQFDPGNPAYANMDRASNGTPIQYAVMETFDGNGVDMGGEISSVSGNFTLDDGTHVQVRVLH